MCGRYAVDSNNCMMECGPAQDNTTVYTVQSSLISNIVDSEVAEDM